MKHLVSENLTPDRAGTSDRGHGPATQNRQRRFKEDHRRSKQAKGGRAAGKWCLVLGLALLDGGCCSHGSKECEEGVSISILHDEPSRIEDMKINYSGQNGDGNAVYRPKEKRFFIEETSDTLGDKLKLKIVLDNTEILNENYDLNWNRAVCNKADGPRWCSDDTYEWAERKIDLREDDELDTE